MEEVIAHSQTSRIRGFISHESPEPGYIAVSFIVHVPNPASGTSSIYFGLVPFFSHPHGICHYISTTVGAHRGAGRSAVWSSDPDGTIFSIERARCYRPSSHGWSGGLRHRQCLAVWSKSALAAGHRYALRGSSRLHRERHRHVPQGGTRVFWHVRSFTAGLLYSSVRRFCVAQLRRGHDGWDHHQSS